MLARRRLTMLHRWFNVLMVGADQRATRMQDDGRSVGELLRWLAPPT